jgi:hypothetical protein
VFTDAANDSDEDEREGLLETDDAAPLAEWTQDQVVEAFKGLSLSKDYSKQIHAHALTGRSLIVMSGEVARFGGLQCIEKLGISCIGDQCTIIGFLQEQQAVGEPGRKQQRPIYKASKKVTTGKALAKDGWRRAKVKAEDLGSDTDQLGGSDFSMNPIFELEGGSSKTFSNPIFELGSDGGFNDTSSEGKKRDPSYVPRGKSEAEEEIGPFGELFDRLYMRVYDLRYQIGLIVAILLLSFWYAFWNRLHTGGHSAVFLFLQLGEYPSKCSN